MIIKKLKVKNLVGHLETELNFQELGPIVAITGRNGSGKTSFFEALPGLLYGELPTRGSLKDNLSDYATNDVVEIWGEIEYGGTEYSLHRTSTPKGIIKEKGRSIAGPLISNYNKFVDSLFGTSKLFLSSVFCSQDHTGDLCEADPTERKKLLGEILDFSKLNLIVMRAKDNVKTLETKVSEKLNRFTNIEQELKNLENTEALLLDTRNSNEKMKLVIDQIKEVKATYDKDVAEVKTVLEQIKTIEAENRHLKEKYEMESAKYRRDQDVINRIKELEEKLSKYDLIKNQYDKLVIKVEQFNREKIRKSDIDAKKRIADRCESKKRETVSKIELLTRNIETFKSGVPCKEQFSDCKFKINIKKDEKEVEIYRNDLEAVEKEKSTLIIEEFDEEAFLVLEKETVLYPKALATMEKLKLYQKELADLLKIDLTKEMPQAPILKEVPQVKEVKVPESLSQLPSLEIQLQNGLKQEGFLESSLEKKVQLQKEYSEVQPEIETIKEDIDLSTELARIFGPNGVQAYIIDTVKNELESISNELIRSIYPDFYIRMETQEELKNKNLKESFLIWVHAGEKVREIRKFSGGEKQIIKLCIRLALSIFISMKSGKMFKTIFIDEAFDHLDLENSAAILELLVGLKKYFHQVFIVSHNEQLLGTIPVVIKFQKTANISSYKIIKN